MKDGKGLILYVGKAGNLRRRVASYFLRPHDYRTQKLVSQIKKIDCKKTDTAIEALILEAELIKKYQPPFNVREKDDTSFLFVEITKEKFPRVILVRGKSRPAGKRYGPFTFASNIRQALRILRRIFPFSTHPASSQINSLHSHEFVDSHRVRRNRPCFDYQIGLCPGTCIGAISRKNYQKNIKNLKLFFEGKKTQVIRSLKKEMIEASKNLEFEKAEKIKRQLFALQHIRDIALITDEKFQFPNSKLNSKLISPISNDRHLSDYYMDSYFQTKLRIEGYDISNISGTSAVGSMVVFTGDKPDKNEYRKFKIRTIRQSDDVGMIKEVLRRRFAPDHLAHGWPIPSLILIDGGKGQVNAAKQVLNEVGFKIPIVGIAKGPERKKNEFIGKIPEGMSEKTLIKVRDEAHRFAISYYRKLHRRSLVTN